MPKILEKLIKNLGDDLYSIDHLNGKSWNVIAFGKIFKAEKLADALEEAVNYKKSINTA